ncbi:hypothetical protein QJQ45_026133 [Haematococcus lacustris]|nr:hypothetical protein QJQ45_026133 [Haematococcus lacustris]
MAVFPALLLLIGIGASAGSSRNLDPQRTIASRAQSASWGVGQWAASMLPRGREDGCTDRTCTSPYKVFVKSTETVGDLTTTCLTVVPLGCYATKTECCAKLAASWQMLSIAADPACEGSVLEVSVAGRSLTEATEFVSGNGSSQVVISDVGLDYWSSMQVGGGGAAAAAAASAAAAGAAAVSFYAFL